MFVELCKTLKILLLKYFHSLILAPKVAGVEPYCSKRLHILTLWRTISDSTVSKTVHQIWFTWCSLGCGLCGPRFRTRLQGITLDILSAWIGLGFDDSTRSGACALLLLLSCKCLFVTLRLSRCEDSSRPVA